MADISNTDTDAAAAAAAAATDKGAAGAETPQTVPVAVVEELRTQMAAAATELETLRKAQVAAERSKLDETERLKLELADAQAEAQSAQQKLVTEGKKSLARVALMQSGVADTEAVMPLLALDSVSAEKVTETVTSLMAALRPKDGETPTVPGVGAAAGSAASAPGAGVDKEMAWMIENGLLG